MPPPFPQVCNANYNLESVLKANIIAHDYYTKTCEQLLSWSDVVDEIHENVTNVEPWMSGNCRGPSSAFCLMYRLFVLKISAKEVKDLLEHRDSPYIRAIGFLFLRYVADPKTLWGWFSPYADDREEFAPSPDGKMVTMGDFVRDLLLEQYYFETIFPRIPTKVGTEIQEELKARGLPTKGKGNAGAGGADRRGVDDGNKRPASVKASLSVAFGQRAPNRAGAREDGRGRDPSVRAALPSGTSDRDRADRDRDYKGTSDRERDHKGGSDRDSRDYRSSRDAADRDRGRDNYGSGSGREREPRDMYRSGGGRDSRDRSPEERYRRSRSRSRDGRREAPRRDYSPARRERSPRRDRSPRRERSRSRSPRRDARDVFRESAPGRDARDVFKERPVVAGGADVRSRY